MHGRILVVDPIATNRIVLRVKLAAAHYDVEQAASIAEAEDILALRAPDAILTAAELPDGDAARLARRTGASGGTIPVVAILPGHARHDRPRLLEAGVDEVEIGPMNDAVLIARLRSLIRASSSEAEWHLRDDTSRALGFAEQADVFARQAQVVFVSTDPETRNRAKVDLSAAIHARIVDRCPSRALDGVDDVDAFVLILSDGNRDEVLPLLAAIRSTGATRHSGVLVVQEDDRNPNLAAHALDLGAGELMVGPVDTDEIALRLKRLIARKTIADRLRATVKTGLEAAVSDPLTGLHNRRYALPHLARVAENARQNHRPFAVMVVDIDHFKRVNDVHGHPAGDAVIIEIAERLRSNVRAVDMVARIGGEEFLIVLPSTGLKNARLAARRLCKVVRDTPCVLPDGKNTLRATVSIGVAVWDPSGDRDDAPSDPPAPESLIDRADKALFGAKAKGRDRVLMDRSAA